MRDIIYERILKMREGAFTYSGWRNVMEDNDENNKCGVRFVHNIKMKCKFVFHALTIFLERKEIDHSLTWKGACKKAVEKIKEFEGVCYVEDNSNNNTHHWVVAKTIMKWFRQF